MIFYIDIDDTICYTEGTDYKKSKPRLDIIAKINKIYDDGHFVCFYTSRGVGTGEDLRDLTLRQLRKWQVKFNQLRMDKPLFDFFIDDKAINSERFLDANTQRSTKRKH